MGLHGEDWEGAACWGQGNSFTKIFSAAARATGPGLLDASEVWTQWEQVLAKQKQAKVATQERQQSQKKKELHSQNSSSK